MAYYFIEGIDTIDDTVAAALTKKKKSESQRQLLYDRYGYEYEIFRKTRLSSKAEAEISQRIEKPKGVPAKPVLMPTSDFRKMMNVLLDEGGRVYRKHLMRDGILIDALRQNKISPFVTTDTVDELADFIVGSCDVVEVDGVDTIVTSRTHLRGIIEHLIFEGELQFIKHAELC